MQVSEMSFRIRAESGGVVEKTEESLFSSFPSVQKS
ncbi:hypothetical protein OPIT5_19760 [Opitutaceae bacterium TAV5]|nr:hypothetical protein OPIT5_19760 [Opitutaceae bacterium TAV5]